MDNDIPGEYGSLETLLDLNGEIFVMDAGYWVKVEAKMVTPSPAIPHGVWYSLTLHDRNNVRVVGFDNAHAVKTKGRKRFSGRKVTWDHKHNMDKVEPYEFESAGQLLDDFWQAVDKQTGG
jgi:hypothetical protein